jgi:hypothetical protein
MHRGANGSVKALFLSVAIACAWTFLASVKISAQTTARTTQAGTAAKRVNKEGNPRSAAKHILIIGIDGLHAFDLETYV